METKKDVKRTAKKRTAKKVPDYSVVMGDELEYEHAHDLHLMRTDPDAFLQEVMGGQDDDI